jgi:glycosyltransferase domain-containing protein
MFEDFTLVVMVHHRHQYLPRLFDYLSSFSGHVIVADSSTEPAKVPASFDHFRAPELTYCQKLVAAHERVATPYVAACADDDFTLMSGIAGALETLRAEPDAACVQGVTSKFDAYTGELWLDYVSRYIPALLVEPPDDPLSERVFRLAGRAQIHYAPMRTSAVLAAYRWLLDHPEYHPLKLWERMFGVAVSMQGQVLFVPRLIQLRDTEHHMTEQQSFRDESRFDVPRSTLRDTRLASTEPVVGRAIEAILSQPKPEWTTDKAAISATLDALNPISEDQRRDIARCRNIILRDALKRRPIAVLLGRLRPRRRRRRFGALVQYLRLP